MGDTDHFSTRLGVDLSNQSTPRVERATRVWHAGSIFAILSILLSVLLSLYPLLCILRYGVSVPFWDEWQFLTYVEQLLQGKMSLGDFLLLRSGEHQLVVQVGLSALGWFASGMNERTLMIWNWAISASFCVLAYRMVATSFGWRHPLAMVALVGSTFFVFNPASYQLILWALTPIYSDLSVIFFLAVAFSQSHLSLTSKLFLLSILNLTASFILGNGLLFWIILPAILCCYAAPSRIWRSKSGVMLYLFFFALTIVGYYLGSKTYTRPSPPAAPGTHFREIIGFFLTYTGNFVSLIQSPPPLILAQAMGGLVIVLFILASYSAVRHAGNATHRSAAIVWVSFGSFWLVSNLSVAAARYSFGLTYALEASRYVLAASFFVVSTIVLGGFAIRSLSTRLPAFVNQFTVLSAIFGSLVFVGVFARFLQTNPAKADMENSRYSELRGKVAAAAANLYQSEAFHGIFPRDDAAFFKREVNFLNHEHWLNPPMWDQSFVNNLSKLAPNPKCGFIDSLFRSGGTVTMGGWAYLPSKHQRAHAIILVTNDSRGNAKIVGVTFPTEGRPDVARILGEAEAFSTGWTAELRLNELPSLDTKFQAVAYDAEEGKACELANGGRPKEHS